MNNDLKEIYQHLCKAIDCVPQEEDVNKDAIIKLINSFIEQKNNEVFIKEKYEERINEILRGVLRLAKFDYSKKIPLTKNKDHFDSLAEGINMLGEELKASALSLTEKEILLKEIHHRVKNNLQVISSLLSLQSESLGNIEMDNKLRASIARVKAMALIHEKLYQSKSLSVVNFYDYMEDLVKNLNGSYSLDTAKVKMHLDIDPDYRHLNIDSAIPCGLIINELLSNSYKYAFPNNNNGNIYLKMGLSSENDKNIKIEFWDDGVGIPKDINIKDSTTLGLQLVSMLAEQIDANLSVERNKGTHFILEFSIN